MIITNHYIRNPITQSVWWGGYTCGFRGPRSPAPRIFQDAEEPHDESQGPPPEARTLMKCLKVEHYHAGCVFFKSAMMKLDIFSLK